MKSILIPLAIFTTLLNSYSQDIEQECTEKFHFQVGSSGSEMSFRENELRECLVGKKIPSFKVITINNVAYDQNELRGNFLILNFWFARCKGCIEEIKVLNEIHQKFKGCDFKVLSFTSDNIEILTPFLKIHNILYEVVSDPWGDLRKNFGFVQVYPMNIFVNKDGYISNVFFGGPSEKYSSSQMIDDYSIIVKKQLLCSVQK